MPSSHHSSCCLEGSFSVATTLNEYLLLLISFSKPLALLQKKRLQRPTHDQPHTRMPQLRTSVARKMTWWLTMKTNLRTMSLKTGIMLQLVPVLSVKRCSRSVSVICDPFCMTYEFNLSFVKLFGLFVAALSSVRSTSKRFTGQ